MARIRSIKPGFCSSEAIAALSIPCRLHFAMLWTYCDDHGRGADNPRVIKGALWPLDDDVTAETIEAWQDELEAKGRLVRYVSGGKRYFVVVNWFEHQKPNRRLKAQHPDPPEQFMSTVDALSEQCGGRVGEESSGERHAGSSSALKAVDNGTVRFLPGTGWVDAV